jgi:GH43 family beta-xylosidase
MLRILGLIFLASCAPAAIAPSGGASPSSSGSDGASASSDGSDGAESALGAAPSTGNAAACTTRITYGEAWLHAASHPSQSDVTSGLVTWDGSCHDDGANSYAVLSNGWKPYFAGHSGCAMALDSSGCAGGPTSCSTRITYDAAWQHPDGHTAQYDDTAGRVFADGACIDSGSSSSESLSNGWVPHFTGAGACGVSLSWSQCGGLYRNPVIAEGCPDPGVLRDGNTWVLTCTSGNAAAAFPLYTSSDLVTWTRVGNIFPSGKRPAWAVSDFWAPEIHKVGSGYVAYFTARGSDGKLSIGAASAPSALGPFTDLGAPLVHDSQMGLIDATEFADAAGAPYLVWKEDGNAVGKPTPIYGQPLAANGLALTGSRTTLITNDRPWEGAVVEGPWVIAHGGTWYLFYSGNSYADGRYALGVARAASPLGPYEKLPDPIVVTNGTWVGPGHGSVVEAPSGETVLLYHAWAAGHVNGPGDSRLVLLDPVTWSNGWPRLPGAPSAVYRPHP